MTEALAAHHAAAGWLADVAMRSVVYRTVSVLMHGLSVPATLLVCAVAGVAYLMWRNA